MIVFNSSETLTTFTEALEALKKCELNLNMARHTNRILEEEIKKAQVEIAKYRNTSDTIVPKISNAYFSDESLETCTACDQKERELQNLKSSLSDRANLEIQILELKKELEKSRSQVDRIQKLTQVQSQEIARLRSQLLNRLP